MKKSIILMLITLFILTGCQKSEVIQTEGNEVVSLIVSKHFGNEVIYNEVLTYKEDQSIMELMEVNLDIKTAYNGGFINSINGLESGYTDKKSKTKTDWFYYVNGFLSQVGSLEYYLKPNDVIVWDYHDWSKKYVSSSVGAYPYDLLNGYGDSNNSTQIIYTDSFSNDIKEIEEYLNNVGRINLDKVSFMNSEIKNDNKNIIVIGLWDEIKENEFISKFYKAGKRTGVFFQFSDNVKILDYNNEVCMKEEKAGIITSFIKDLGNMTKLYLVTGNDYKCIKKALEIMSKDENMLRGKYSVLVSEEDEVINFPLIKSEE